MSGLILGITASSRPAGGAFELTISSNIANLDVHQHFVDNGWDGTKEAQLTIDSGVYVYANGGVTNNVADEDPGILYDTAFPNGLTIINNGYIMGQGGTYTKNSSNAAVYVPATPAINVTAAGLSIDNQGTIAGGGGQGGASMSTFTYATGGGGAGGGGIDFNNTTNANAGYRGRIGSNAKQGVAGSPGNAGTNGSTNTDGSYGGGAGGRVLPGTGGVAQAATTNASYYGVGGGSGGAGGRRFVYISMPGSDFATRYYVAGGGGGYGAAGGDGYYVSFFRSFGLSTKRAGSGGDCNLAGGDAVPYNTQYAGQAGANAVKLNSNTVTFINNGTLYGAVS